MLVQVEQEPERVGPGGALARKMSTLPRRDTAPELLLRRELREAGWEVVRVWEREDPVAAADRVERVWRARVGRD